MMQHLTKASRHTQPEKFYKPRRPSNLPTKTRLSVAIDTATTPTNHFPDYMNLIVDEQRIGQFKAVEK